MYGELLKKHLWLIRTLIRAGSRGLSLNELSEKYENKFGHRYPRRTFNNHRESIETIFGITIECDRNSFRYHLADSSAMNDESTAISWLINSFAVRDVLNNSKDKLAGRIAVEDIPSGHKHLIPAMEAMMDNCEISIEYQKYTSGSPETLTIHPYAVKESARRWYLIGYCTERQGIRVYGMDRILSLNQLDSKFELPRNFDVDELYATSFGIWLPDIPGTMIRFRATHKEARFLRDLPLHSSQKEEGSDENGVIFSIFAAPDITLIMELCKLGNRVEVLEPKEIRDAVATELEKAYKMYNMNKYDK